MSKDKVNHPDHYTQGGIECIDALAAAVSKLSGIEAFCTANAIKYLWRWKHKNGDVDLCKAKWYIDYLLMLHTEESHINQPDIPLTDGVIDIEGIEVGR